MSILGRQFFVNLWSKVFLLNPFWALTAIWWCALQRKISEARVLELHKIQYISKDLLLVFLKARNSANSRVILFRKLPLSAECKTLIEREI